MRGVLLPLLFFTIALDSVHARSEEPVKLEKANIEGAFREYAKLAAKYHIELVLEKPEFPKDGTIRGREADRAKIATFLALFKSEWSFYPPELMPTSGLTTVVFCEDLVFGSRPVPGTAGGGENGDHLYINVAANRWSKTYIRSLIHHEFFHVVDRRMHMNAGDRYGLTDKQWESLNSPGFSYDQVLSSATADFDPKLQGFLSKYSQSAVYEDKAEVYAHMITMGKIVEERAKTDPVLQAKVDRMKKIVKDFCPQMDDDFWAAARKVVRYGGG